MAEENFDNYFAGDISANPEKDNYARYGVPGNRYAWSRYHQRFDLDAEPNAANRYGWIVEVDPLDPRSTPIKRTALGRFKHEGAETIVNRDGRLVVYSGDDQRFEFLYKFVSADRIDLNDRAANRDLLDNDISERWLQGQWIRMALSLGRIRAETTPPSLARYDQMPEPPQARQQLGLPDMPTVACTGSLYAGRGVETVMALAKRLTYLRRLIGMASSPCLPARSPYGCRELPNTVGSGAISGQACPGREDHTCTRTGRSASR